MDTLNDFGTQWNRYPDYEGYLGSQELLKDTFFPLVSLDEIKGIKAAEIGSGAGRFASMLAQHVDTLLAIEPSNAFPVLQKNVRLFQNVTCLRAKGDAIPPDNFDYIFSIGVLHHIPDPKPVIEAAYNALKPGGKIFIWLYSFEGNELYVYLTTPLRFITSRLPPFLLSGICYSLVPLLSLYAHLCKVLPFPMQKYMVNVILPLSWKHRMLTIYDQLNPVYAKYYKKDEAIALLRRFKKIRIHHRHGYSWALTAEKQINNE